MSAFLKLKLFGRDKTKAKPTKEAHSTTELVTVSQALSHKDLRRITKKSNWEEHYNGYLTAGRFVLIANSDKVKNCIVDLATKERTDPPEIEGNSHVLYSPDGRYIASHYFTIYACITDTTTCLKAGKSDMEGVEEICWADNTTLGILNESGTLRKMDVTKLDEPSVEVLKPAALEVDDEHSHLDYRCGVSPCGKWWILQRRWVLAGKEGESPMITGTIECLEYSTKIKKDFRGSAFAVVDIPSLNDTGPLLLAVDSEPGFNVNMSFMATPLNDPPTDAEVAFSPVHNKKIQFQELDKISWDGPDYPFWIGALPRLQLAIVVTMKFWVYIIDIKTATQLHVVKLEARHQQDCLPLVDGDSVVLLSAEGNVQRVAVHGANLTSWTRNVVKNEALASSMEQRV